MNETSGEMLNVVNIRDVHELGLVGREKIFQVGWHYFYMLLACQPSKPAGGLVNFVGSLHLAVSGFQLGEIW